MGNTSSEFTTISNGGYTTFAPGGNNSESGLLAVGVTGSWWDGATPAVGAAINMDITSWGGTTPGYRSVYGVPVKIAASNPSATSTGFYADVTGAGTNWAFYAANGNSYFGGNVGIGTTSPGAALDVNGNIKGNGTLNVVNSGGGYGGHQIGYLTINYVGGGGIPLLAGNGGTAAVAFGGDIEFTSAGNSFKASNGVIEPLNIQHNRTGQPIKSTLRQFQTIPR